MNNQTSIADVLSGNAPIQVNVALDIKSAIYLGVALFLAFSVGMGVALTIYKKA